MTTSKRRAQGRTGTRRKRHDDPSDRGRRGPASPRGRRPDRQESRCHRRDPERRRGVGAGLQTSQDAGIKVIVHEQPGQKNADWDIELIQDKQFGEAHLEAFAEAIGGEGKYVVYVGGLTVTLHNVWADAAVALQKAKYPKMQQVGDRYGVSNSVEDSQKTAADVMRANPDLKGFLIFGANGPIGAGQAVADADKIGKVIVVGPFIPSQGQKLMKSGAITRGYLWNPIDAGYAMVQLGNLLATGKTPSTAWISRASDLFNWGRRNGRSGQTRCSTSIRTRSTNWQS